MVNKVLNLTDKELQLLKVLGTFTFPSDVTVNGDLTVTGSSNIGVDETITGQLLLDDGSAANPALTFASDAHLGMYKPFTDSMAFTVNSSARFLVGTTNQSYANFLPGNDSYYDLGSTLRYWKNSFFDKITLQNDGWLVGNNSANTDTINMFKVNTNDEIGVGATLNAGPMEFSEDSGAVTVMNMPVTSDSSDGDEMSMSFSIDSNPVLKVKGDADGIGGTDNFQILISKGSASLPGFSFINDPHTGFYNNGSGSVQFRSNGSSGPIFSTGILFGNANKPYFLNANSSDTVPVLLPAQGDINTGIGHAGTNQLSLISDGVEGLRIDGNESEVQPMMTLTTGPNEFEEDSGAITGWNMPVSSTPSAGDEMSYTFSIDSNPVLKVKGSANGTGGAESFQVVNYGGRIRNTTIVNSATYNLLETDDILLVTYTSTGAVTSLTLPSAQTVNGRVIVIKDAGGNATTNNITIDTEGSEMIDGSATAVIDGDYESVTLVSDGSNWFLI